MSVEHGGAVEPEMAPAGFRPLADLTPGKWVDLALRTGVVATGWLVVGMTGPQDHTYFARMGQITVPVYPLGWREATGLGIR